MQTRHDELLSELVALGARISAAEHRHLTLIRELGKCTRPLEGTFAEWIAWRCHVDPKTAYEMIRVADALEHLRIIDKLFAEGRLSYSKVRVITRHADERTDEVWAGPCRGAPRMRRSQAELKPDAGAQTHPLRHLLARR